MNAKGFIFDMDGTLLDSMPSWGKSGPAYLRSLNVKDPPDNLAEMVKVLSLSQAAAYFREQFGLSCTEQDIMDGINAYMAERYQTDLDLKPGVREFLQKHKGKPMCVATATEKTLAEAVLARLGILDYFDFVLTSGEVGSNKQNPDIFNISAERLGLNKDEVIIFEDAFHAIETAKKEGFFVVALEDDAYKAQREEIKRIADVYAKTFCEVQL